MGGLTFGVDSDGNPGYIKAGADTVTPFKSGLEFIWKAQYLAGAINISNTGHVTLEVMTSPNAASNIIIIGTNDPLKVDNYYAPPHDYNSELLGTFPVKKIGDIATIDTGTEYPYLVLHCVYVNNSWNACVKIST